MNDNFTKNEIGIFGCFISPKYPKATRTLKAVAKETNLEESVVLGVFELYEGQLFLKISQNKWMFNLPFFAAKFHEKYPHLFVEFTISKTDLGLVIGPKSISPKQVHDILKNIADDPTQPEHLCNLVESVIKANESAACGPKPLSEPSEVWAFST